MGDASSFVCDTRFLSQVSAVYDVRFFIDSFFLFIGTLVVTIQISHR